jgi:prepilin-type processing-associated H-X9-DG protein
MSQAMNDLPSRRKLSAVCVVSLICGVLFFVPFVTGLIAIITGLLGLRQTGTRTAGPVGSDGLNGTGAAKSGRGLAIAGMALGASSIVLWIGMIAILVPAFERMRESARQMASLSNLRQIATAYVMYANENLGYVPPTPELLVGERGFLRSTDVFRSPFNAGGEAKRVYGELSSDYVFVKLPEDSQGRMQRVRNAGEVVIAYDGSGLAGGLGAGFAYADGHVEWREDADARTLAEGLVEVEPAEGSK